MQGFNEMKRRIKPHLIIVYGNMIEEMTGRFINIKYKDAFQKNKKCNYEQISMFEKSRIFERKDVI